MKPITKIVLITASCMISYGASGQGNSNNNGNGLAASVAALEVEVAASNARIDTLEALIANPGNEDAVVAGSSYRIFSLSDSATVINEVPYQSHTQFTRISEVQFYTDGNGYWDSQECNRVRLTNPDYFENDEPALSTIWELGCSGLGDFAYTQSGNILDIVFTSGFSISIEVSANGNVILGGDSGYIGNQPFEDVTLDSLFRTLIIGMRLQ